MVLPRLDFMTYGVMSKNFVVFMWELSKKRNNNNFCMRKLRYCMEEDCNLTIKTMLKYAIITLKVRVVIVKFFFAVEEFNLIRKFHLFNKLTKFHWSHSFMTSIKKCDFRPPPPSLCHKIYIEKNYLA